jgi:hypothetical protein
MFKTFLTAVGAMLYERVFKAYKTTLLAMALATADVVVTQLNLLALPGWAHGLVAIVATVLTFYKKAAPATT